MAKDLKTMLAADFSKNLNQRLYLDVYFRKINQLPKYSETAEEKQTPKTEQSQLFAKPETTPSPSAPEASSNVERQPLTTLYDLFGVTEKERQEAVSK